MQNMSTAVATKSAQKPALKSLPEFIGTLPPTLKIPANKESTIITDGLQNSDITVSEGSNTTFIALLQKGWEDLKKINFNFAGENATLNFIAFIIGKNQEKFPFETFSNHTTPRNNAYYYVRCALFDRAEVDYTGNLIIKKTAQITDSYLAHHTLMLSKHAKTRTVPSLEIEADDVKAGHAATIGRVDEDLTFYLESRGLNKELAQELLIKAFMQTDLEKIPNEKIRAAVAQEIDYSLC